MWFNMLIAEEQLISQGCSISFIYCSRFHIDVKALKNKKKWSSSLLNVTAYPNKKENDKMVLLS